MFYTLGTSNRPLGEFIHELERRNITYLVDVRSLPYSSRFPWFNRQQIERWAEHQGRMYRWEPVLGGKSETPLDHPDYVAALDRLLSGAGRENVAIFCAEGDPAACHRTYDIGASLLVRYGVVARSILRDGREEDVTESLRRVAPGIIPECIEVTVRQAISSDDRSEMLLF